MSASAPNPQPLQKLAKDLEARSQQREVEDKFFEKKVEDKSAELEAENTKKLSILEAELDNHRKAEAAKERTQKQEMDIRHRDELADLERKYSEEMFIFLKDNEALIQKALEPGQRKLEAVKLIIQNSLSELEASFENERKTSMKKRADEDLKDQEEVYKEFKEHHRHFAHSLPSTVENGQCLKRKFESDGESSPFVQSTGELEDKNQERMTPNPDSKVAVIKPLPPQIIEVQYICARTRKDEHSDWRRLIPPHSLNLRLNIDNQAFTPCSQNNSNWPYTDFSVNPANVARAMYDLGQGLIWMKCRLAEGVIEDMWFRFQDPDTLSRFLVLFKERCQSSLFIEPNSSLQQPAVSMRAESRHGYDNCEEDGELIEESRDYYR